MQKVWRITGYNRHPSIVDTLKEDIIPLFGNAKRLQVASVPCATGIETLALAIELEKLGLDFIISGFDVDPLAIQAAKLGLYELNPITGQIVGDPLSGFEYQWGNLTQDDKDRFFRERNAVGVRHLESAQEIISKIAYSLQGIEDLPKNAFDIIVCLNFLKYLTDPKYMGGLPTLENVSRKLYDANVTSGVLLTDPKAAKSQAVDASLREHGYSVLRSGAYIKV